MPDMHWWKRAQVLSAMMVLVSLFVMIVYHDSLVLTSSASAIVVLLMIAMIWGERKHQQERSRHDIQRKQLLFIRIFNHHQHDWMNELQVLFGYIQLKKYDRLSVYVESMRGKLELENRIIKLGNERLSLFLLAVSSQSHVMTLELEMKEEFNLGNLSIEPDQIYEIIEGWISQFKRLASAAHEEPSHLKLVLDLDEHRLLLGFIYQGDFNEDELRTVWERTIKTKLYRKVDYRTQYEQRKAEVWLTILPDQA